MPCLDPNKPPDPLTMGWRAGPPFVSLAASHQNGGAAFWGVKNNNQLCAIFEDPRWGSWQGPDWAGAGFPQLTTKMAATEAEGSLQFWALDDRMKLWHVEQTSPGGRYSPWQPNWNSAPPDIQSLAAVSLGGERSAQVWAILSSNYLMGCYKRSRQHERAPGTWSMWQPWPTLPTGLPLWSMTAAQQNDGLAALWALDVKLQLWACFEESPGGRWSTWAGPNYNSAPLLFHITACQQGGSRGASLWGITRDYELINCYELTPGGKWSGWSKGGWMNSPPGVGIVAAQQKDGTARLWMTSVYGYRLGSIAQTSPGGDWGRWDPFNFNVPPDPPE